MDNIQAQIQRLQAEIARQETELADLEADLLDIQHELADFARRYDRLVQPLVSRLDTIRAVFADLEARLNPPPQTSMIDETGWNPPPDYIPVEEQFRRTWRVPQEDNEAPPLLSTWKPEPDYIPVEEQFRRTWRRPSGESVSPDAAPSAETDSKKTLKDLYRQLARRYHPDLATDPTERQRRNRLMAEINRAYSERDLSALQALIRQPETVSVDEPLAVIQLRQLQQIRTQLERRLDRLRQERSGLFNSDLMWLKVQESLLAKKKRNLIGEMVEQLERDYAVCLDRIDQLRRM
jgi:chromosome segregation ATPase